MPLMAIETRYSVAPTVTDDISKGYGDRWLWENQATSLVYKCTDNSLGAAVWQPLAISSTVINQLLTGYSSGAGTVTATDSILQAIQKLNGNDTLKQDKAPSKIITAGEELAAGSVVYLKSDGKYWGTDADAYATTAGELLYVPTLIAAEATGLGYEEYDIAGVALTPGTEYFISATKGAYTSTEPTTAGQSSRVVARATSTTNTHFKPCCVVLGY